MLAYRLVKRKQTPKQYGHTFLYPCVGISNVRGIKICFVLKGLLFKSEWRILPQRNKLLEIEL